jgi:hypothetical protein
MIFFKAQGRLGNQIFQYAFLQSKKRKREKIFSVGFDELLETFEITDVINISKKSKYLVYLINKVLLKLLNSLACLGLISSITIIKEKILNNYVRETSSFKIKKGLISSTFINEGYFQSHTFFKDDFRLKSKKILLKQAQDVLSNIPSGSTKIFVHVRRGDYKDFKIYGKSTLLPFSYYESAINKAIEYFKNPYFIFLTDEFLENEFNSLKIKNKVVFNSNKYGLDFAIMTMCEGAILSPSSFSWWGAYFMKKMDFIIAPKFWLGFNSQIDFQSNPIPPFFKTILVK